MKAGIACLILAYVLSQFYRAFLAVMAPALTADLGVTPADLAEASALWFLVFAALQLPIGWALDRIGPRRTASALLLVGGAGGATLFAAAPGGWAIAVAMALIGAGCAPVLMAAYFILARELPAAVFATLAGMILGFGTLGNLVAALPLALVVEAAGWRAAMAGLAALTGAVALAVWLTVRDPVRLERRAEDGSIRDVLRLPALWLVIALTLVNYAPAAGIRGLWAGPYLTEVFGATAAEVGLATLMMGAAMVAGSFLYGPLDRIFGTRKGVALTGNLAGLACLVGLWLMPSAGFWTAALLMAGLGFFCSSFPVLMAHGRAFFPPHLAGRGVTILNLFAIGGVGLFQYASGPVHAAAAGAGPVAAYSALFGFFALALAAGCLAYAFARDRTD